MLRAVRIPSGVLKIVKEVLRHLLRRPVVGIAVAARTADGRLLLIRRADSGKWALWAAPWSGARPCACHHREVVEETGARVHRAGRAAGRLLDPERDPRFHAVNVIVGALVTEPDPTVVNPVEISEVRLFHESELPTDYSHGMQDIIQNAISKNLVWE
jgi:8-oxo-dGTP diphosphatase